MLWLAIPILGLVAWFGWDVIGKRLGTITDKATLQEDRIKIWSPLFNRNFELSKQALVNLLLHFDLHFKTFNFLLFFLDYLLQVSIVPFQSFNFGEILLNLCVQLLHICRV